jgi:serine/threonine protein kinase
LTISTPRKQPIVFGRYLLLDRVNIGGMAEVWRGKVFGAGGFERLVAVKRILPNIAEDEEFISMFQDEAKISVQLTHANICQIYELNRIGPSLYIAMEYVPGKDLRSIFERARKKGEPPPVPLVCYVIGKLCEGLDYAHRKKDSYGRELNVVHRDVSPQNVLISFEGEVKVIDFGIAKATGKVTKTQAGILKGKFGYMSPEQIRGLPLDRRSDVFAIGVCLYELLTGERLFVGESDFQVLEKVRKAEVLPPSTYNRKIPEALERIVLKALSRDPEARFQYASELGDELQRFLITSDSIFSRKDLMQYMKSTFAEEVERERARVAEYADIKAPEAMVTGESGSMVPVVGRTTGPILTAVPTPPGGPSVVVRGTSLPRLTAAPAQVQPREDEGSTLLVDGNEVFGGAPATSRTPVRVQTIAGDDPQTDPERVARGASEPAIPADPDDVPISPTDETIVRPRPEQEPTPLPPPPSLRTEALAPPAPSPPAPAPPPVLEASPPLPAPERAAPPPLPRYSEPVPTPAEGHLPPPVGSPGALAPVPLPTPWAEPAPPRREQAAGSGGRWGWVLLGLLILGGGAAAAAYFLRTPVTGRLVIDLTPAEAKPLARLRVGGTDLGVPARWPVVRSLPSGRVEVLVSADGYQPALVDATVPRGGDALPVVVSLQKAATTARLVIVSEPDDAEVRLNGAVVKRAGTRGFYVAEVPLGAPQDVQVRRPGYRPFSTQVSPRTAETPTEVRTTLEPLDIPVLVTSVPAGAVVFSGERMLGVTPFSSRVPATATALTFRKRCFETAQVPLKLPEQPGPRVPVRATLRKVPGCR